MTFAEELGKRAEQIRSDLGEQQKLAKVINDRVTELQADLNAVLHLLQKESKGKETKGAHKPEPQLVALPQPSAADVVRTIMRDAPQGLTPKQIRDMMRQKGMKVNANYVYRFLYRYKANGKVEERNGRYSLVEAKAAAAS